MEHVIPIVVFAVFWLFMLFYQCRSPKKYNGRIDIKEYVFCSNCICRFPTWLIILLFFNRRLTKLPLTLMIGQAINYLFLFVELFITSTVGSIPLFHIHFGVFVTLLIVMCIDHEIYCFRHRKQRF